MAEPVFIIKNLNICQKILSKEYVELYKLKFNKDVQLQNEEKLKQEREPKINKTGKIIKQN